MIKLKNNNTFAVCRKVNEQTLGKATPWVEIK